MKYMEDIMTTTTVKTINIRGALRDFRRPWVMGIVNVTPDSFYAGSRTQCVDDIRARVGRHVADGADCIDIGGYSSRPGADDISEDEEWRRVATALEVVRGDWPDVVVSVDTFRADVARKTVEQYGVDIINDISGGDLCPKMWETIADLRVAYVLMHMKGTPATMQGLASYDDVAADVLSDLASKVARLRAMGVDDIIIDPGFGFAKTIDQNYRLLSELECFQVLGLPVLAGLSHKSMIWKTLDTTPDKAAEGTVALDTVALMKGADIVRVHEVAPAVETVTLLMKMREASLCNGANG